MRRIKKWFREIFDPQDFNDLDTGLMISSFNDPVVRAEWFVMVLEEIRHINLSVDKKLLVESELGLIDLCARRKGIQDVLEMILSARRRVTQGEGHNPRVPVPAVNLDRVTA